MSSVRRCLLNSAGRRLPFPHPPIRASFFVCIFLACLPVPLAGQSTDLFGPPQVTNSGQKETTIEGVLEIWSEDDHTGGRILYLLDTAAEQLSLHFTSGPPAGLRRGAFLRVRGTRVGQDIILDKSGITSAQPSADEVSGAILTSAAVEPSLGEQKTVVILVNFQDAPNYHPYTVDYARNVVFGQSNNFFLENSQNRAWLSGDVFGWFTIPVNSTTCAAIPTVTYAREAATAAGVDLSMYSRQVIAWPEQACSPYWGAAEIGGTPTLAWINGSLELKIVTHEMGHNFGLYHSNALDCGSSSFSGNCTPIEYGDTVDTMGNPAAGHYTAFQKERLGWLDATYPGEIATVTSSGTYTLDPFESAAVNPKALKIQKSKDPVTGARTWYYVEYRRAIGFDSFLSTNSNVTGGVLIHTGSESDPNTCYLLDMTPATASWLDPALVAGQTFRDSYAGVVISVRSAGGTTATVDITAPPLPPNSPTGLKVVR